MNLVLTLGIVLSLLITFAPIAEVQAQKSSADLEAAQNQKNIDICTQNLLTLGKALETYQKAHGDLPDWLSELYPKYLPDADLLLCPADEMGGTPIFTHNADPKMPVSYGYQFYPEYRELKGEQRQVYGDAMPLVRCRHHKNQPFDCLNLSFAFKVYPSSHVWENTPEEMYGTPEKAIEALEAGLQKQPDSRHALDLYIPLARLYIEVGREKEVNTLINRFKSNMEPDDLQAHSVLSAVLELANRDEEVLKLFQNLEQHHPNSRYVLDELARMHEKLGNSELAAEYRKKADPMSALVGKVVPNFSATDLDGKPISLQDYRGKVVLLDFWAVWCGPCVGEMPNVKKVYETHKDKGFDIIGISLDTDEERLRNYLKENDIRWRQIYSGKGWDSPLAKQYHIRGIPAPWLLARDGTLISREARGVKLERLVLEALRDNVENK